MRTEYSERSVRCKLVPRYYPKHIIAGHGGLGSFNQPDDRGFIIWRVSERDRRWFLAAGISDDAFPATLLCHLEQSLLRRNQVLPFAGRVHCR